MIPLLSHCLYTQNVDDFTIFVMISQFLLAQHIENRINHIRGNNDPCINLWCVNINDPSLFPSYFAGILSWYFGSDFYCLNICVR